MDRNRLFQALIKLAENFGIVSERARELLGNVADDMVDDPANADDR